MGPLVSKQGYHRFLLKTLSMSLSFHQICQPYIGQECQQVPVQECRMVDKSKCQNSKEECTTKYEMKCEALPGNECIHRLT